MNLKSQHIHFDASSESLFDHRQLGNTDRAGVGREVRAQLIRAWRLMFDSQHEESLRFAAAIASRLHELDAAPAKRCRVHVRLIRAVGNALADDPAALLSELADPAIDPHRCRLTRLLLRFAYWRLARWSDLYKLAAADRIRSSCEVMTHIFDLAVLAAAAFEKLQLITASRFAADALALAHRHGFDGSIAAASAAIVLASVRYELGYIDHAEELLLGRLPALRAHGTPDVIIRAYWLLLRIAQHRARYEHAAVVLNEGQHLGEQRSCPRIVVALMGERVRMLLARNEIELARQEVAVMQHYTDVHPVAAHAREEIAELCVLATVRVAQAETSTMAAVKTLEDLVRSAIANNRLYTAFHRRLELAEALSKEHADEAADRLLVRLLEHGEHLGMLQCWVDTGNACGRLLARIARQLSDTDSARLTALDPYLRTLLAHRMASENIRPVRRTTLHVCERLSTRERTVLALIAKGQSNKRVAQLLKVTPETIKSHLKRVFVKLGAKSRAEAVSRAANLGQLIDVVLPAETEQEKRVAPDWRRLPMRDSIQRPYGEGRSSPARDGFFHLRAAPFGG